MLSLLNQIESFLPLFEHLTREQKIQRLRQTFLDFLVEDPIDGTTFDCDVLDALKELEEKYGQTSPQK